MSQNTLDVTFVTTRSGSPEVFEKNFSASPGLSSLPQNRIIVQEEFVSASIAYNEAIEKAETDIIVFAHQDVFFPSEWLRDLEIALKYLEFADPEWGVLGCCGVDEREEHAGYLYSVGLGILGQPFPEPLPVKTLDEFILILRKSSGLRFDENLPGFHFYGTDICLTARQQGKRCYAISAFSVHNTSYGPLSAAFYKYYWNIKRKWKASLPIQTPCIKITKWNEDFVIRRFKDVCFTLMGRDMKLLRRLDDPRTALRALQQTAPQKPSVSDREAQIR